MSSIVQCVISMREDFVGAVDNYIDDIVIDESRVSLNEVVSHLSRYGLQVKPMESIVGSRVLGLRMCSKNDGTLEWVRGNELSEVSPAGLKQRELFSHTGKLVGHFPVCSWLRVACSYIKRQGINRGLPRVSYPTE